MLFSRLELEPNDAMAAESTQLANQAIEAARAEGVTLSRDDLPALAAMLDRLAARHTGAEIDDESVAGLARLYGSLLGEIVRARTGGAWGIGLQFGGQLPFGGLLIGYIKFWPCHEARDRIAGRPSMPLVERIDRLCEHAKTYNNDEPPKQSLKTRLVAISKRIFTRSAKDSRLYGVDGERLYPLKAGEGYFDAGVTRDGRLALMGAFSNETTIVFFSPDGTCLGVQEWSSAAQRSNEDMLRVVQTKLGFVAQTIRVKRFSVGDDPSLGIEELPGSYQDLQDDPDSEYDADQRGERLAAIDEWKASGCFVLHWANDLWLDGTGHVTSS